MYNVDVYKVNPTKKGAKIKQLTGSREWMHQNTHNCFPLMSGNIFGYGIYFDEDISFRWDGDRSTPAVGLIGKEHIWEGRGDGTVSFSTGLVFKTNENTSILTMSVPNQEMPGITVMSTILSTSFFYSDLPVVWKINDSMIGKEIFIPAGTNIACILPISIAQFQDSIITIHDEVLEQRSVHSDEEYIKTIKQINNSGKKSNFYKNGTDQYGNIVGKHEVDRLRMTVIDKRK